MLTDSVPGSLSIGNSLNKPFNISVNTGVKLKVNWNASDRMA